MKNALLIGCAPTVLRGATILALSLATLAFTPARTGPIRSGSVPVPLVVGHGHEPFAKYQALGMQQYVCLPKDKGFAWVLYGPQATLFDQHGDQVGTHFLSTNSHDAQISRPTWQSSRDTSAVWGDPIASSTDPHYVAPGAIPWLLLEAAAVQAGPTGGASFKQTTYIQRINTTGGLPLESGCTRSEEVGAKALIPYTADYVFYRSTRAGSR